MLKDQLDADLKSALLAGDKPKALILRGLKSAILYEEVKLGKKDQGLSEEEIIMVLAKEQKKRGEAADMYRQAGDEQRTAAELAESQVIAAYLPQQLSDETLQEIITTEIKALNATTMADMGKVIASVRQKTAGAAEGALIAQLVKKALSE